ncbi:hypothetical protein TcWFU_004438 [Taenia crassiceps]|uniref:Uncharacterized protein n=1 Tax=Taenia crassiceps TaxID=6207 RepID=A0ABR4QDG4_9CEST
MQCFDWCGAVSVDVGVDGGVDIDTDVHMDMDMDMDIDKSTDEMLKLKLPGRRGGTVGPPKDSHWMGGMVVLEEVLEHRLG